MKTYALIGLYLSAIVIANLTVAWFGPGVVVVNAFVLIALDLTARDRLHEAWEGAHLRRNMAALIAAGSVLSAVLDWQALPVAVASFCAFALAGVADTLVYARMSGRGWFAKVNGSNVVSALVDSAVFLSILAAIGQWLALPDALPWALVPPLVLAQWSAKTIGGALWAYILRPRYAPGRA